MPWDLAAQLEELDLEEGLELLDSVPHPQERVLGDFCITPSPLTLDQLGVLNGEEPSGDDSYVRLARREVDALTPGTLSLPSASELEFAALGGCQGAFFWGNDLPDAGRWNEDPSNPHADSTNQYGLTDVLAYREWCREAGALRVKGGAADLFPWQGAEGLLMLPSLTERPGPTEVGLVRLVFRWA